MRKGLYRWRRVELILCPSCSAEAIPTDRYCRKCGKSLQSFYSSVFARPPQDFGQASNQVSFTKKTPALQLPAQTTGTVTKHTIAVASSSARVGRVKTEFQEVPVQLRPVAQQQAGAVDQTSLRALIRRIQELEMERDQLRRERWKTRATPSKITFGVLLILGAAALLGAIAYASTILAFIGLGLSFYGMLFLFIRPTKYVESETLESALSPIRTLDLLLSQLGYQGRGIHLPAGNGVMLFVPEGDGSKLGMNLGVSENLQTLTNSSQGVMLSPPGLALTRIIEKDLGADLSIRGLGSLEEKLPKMLIEGPQMVKEMQMQVEGDHVRFRFTGSIYCDRLRNDGGKCSPGCPLCSALACILVRTTGRPIVFEDESRSGRDTFESTYRIVEES
jgi:hypothetical protein